MRVNVLTKLLVACLGCALAQSCASDPPATPPSYSIQLSQAVADQRVFDCGTLKPEKLPTSSQELIDTLPPRLEGETDYAYRYRLSEAQRGLFDWIQLSIRVSARWRGYCST